MSEPRVIKKYPNRRLYDTVESRYITLAEIQRLVVEKIDFVVVDKKSNAEITRSILLQVISEQEHQADPILSQEFMIQIIRSYGSSLQPIVSGYLEQSMKSLLNEQAQIRERVKALGGGLETNGQRPTANPRTRDLGRELAREFSEKDREEPVEHK
jgi:polyhydroxyalkanoate synthesis repressor PhaR